MAYFKISRMIVCVLTGLLLTSCAVARQATAENIALGKKVTFSLRPNYSLCTDPDDNIQLTDGEYSDGGNATSLWVQKSTVGWQSVLPVVITIDLGSIQPISGVSYSTAAGRAGVLWPTAIYMATSDDNQTWHYAGDLVLLSKKNGVPPPTGYKAFRYVTHDLQTKGRYISFGVASYPLVFADEIEVYKGDDAWLSQPAAGRVVSSLGDMVKGAIITSYAQRRMNTDIANIRDAINQSNVPSGSKSTFNARLDKDADAAARMEPLPVDFKTILPLNDIHRDILAVRGGLLAAQGLPSLVVWKKHRYDWLPLLAAPNTSDKPRLEFSLLGNQFRSDDLLLTNASEKSQNITLRLNGIPHSASSGWLHVYSVAWTDTTQNIPVADALLPIELQNSVYQIEVPAGMTRKVWFTVDSSELPAGSYKSTFVVNGTQEQVSIPLSINVSKIAMGTPRFSLGMWDYTNGNGSRAITPQNREAAIKLMRSHYVDTPWATGSVLPLPDAHDFDAQGNLTAELNFSNLDEWIAMWPGARHYMIVPGLSDSMAGAKINTPEFNVRVGNWAKAVSAHMKTLGLQPEQLGFLLVDEPRNDTMDAFIAAWAKAINAAAPELTLFENPNWERPDQTKIQDAITQIDILCPQFPIYKRGGEPVQKYFESLRAAGKTLWFYQCTGPVRLYDPQGYYRYQAWNAFGLGATGEDFWSFGDTGGAPTSWNEYAITRINYAPAFIDKDTVYGSVHWDAVREGIEDYEELAMLQDRIKTTNDAAWKNRAQDVLKNAVVAITGSWTGAYNWQDAKDPDLADKQLQLVRKMLDE